MNFHIALNSLQDGYILFKSPKLVKIACYLKLLYFFDLIFKKKLSKQKQELTYGRTPLNIWRLIASDLIKGQTILDLGCGEGIGLFFLNKIKEVKCMGIDLEPSFIENGKFITCHFSLKDMEFIHDDLLKTKLPEADVYFMAGTCFSDQLCQKIVKDIMDQKPLKIYSISTSLFEYGLQGYTSKEVQVRMDFGKTSLFILSRI